MYHCLYERDSKYAIYDDKDGTIDLCDGQLIFESIRDKNVLIAGLSVEIKDHPAAIQKRA